MRSKRWALVLLLAAIGAAAYGGTVLATPATTPGFSGTTLAKATFGELDIKAHTIPADLWKAQLKTKGDSDLYVQQNTWDPSLCGPGCIPSSGWHTHPGPSLVIVTQGSVTEYDGDDPACTPHVYSANGTNAFVDIGSGAVHIIRDESGAVAKTVVVQLIPKDATRRIDVTPAPGNCPF
jgi:hypothetical protein